MLRDVVETDLPIFYRQQLDPEATRMAGFRPREEWADFLAHWQRIRSDPTCRQQTIVWNEQVAGYIGSWPQEGQRLVAYWIDREHWGRGIATAALTEYLGLERVRPLHAFVAVHNIGSMRVLVKCGFKRTDDAMAAPDEVGEYLFRLS